MSIGKGSDQCVHRKMEESGCVLGKSRIRSSIEKLFELVPKRVQPMCAPKNGTIRMSTKKKYNPCEYRKTVRMSTRNGSNHCEYRKMVESVRVPGKGRIRASVEKLLRWVPEKGPINVSTEKLKNPSEYQEKVESVRVTKNCSDGYRKRFQSM